MRTLLLLSSSKFLTNDLTDILGKPLSAFRIAHIITASKGQGVDDLSYLDRTRGIFKQAGCYFEDLDLDGKNEEELKNILKNFNAVFVNGGSSFYLLKSIRTSGFDKVIKDLLPRGFLYIGGSAGTYVACPTIEMALWRHQDRYDHCGLTDFTALDLIPFLITVHYFPEYESLLKKGIAAAKYPTKILTDEQAILIKDGEIKIFGGEEIKL